MTTDEHGYPAGPAFVATSLSVHLYLGVAVRVRLHPAEDRAVVGIGADARYPGPTSVHLFMQRTELVALRDALAAAVSDLDTTQDGTNGHGHTSSDDVDTPAA